MDVKAHMVIRVNGPVVHRVTYEFTDKAPEYEHSRALMDMFPDAEVEIFYDPCVTLH